MSCIRTTMGSNQAYVVGEMRWDRGALAKFASTLAVTCLARGATPRGEPLLRVNSDPFATKCQLITPLAGKSQTLLFWSMPDALRIRFASQCEMIRSSLGSLLGPQMATSQLPPPSAQWPPAGWGRGWGRARSGGWMATRWAGGGPGGFWQAAQWHWLPATVWRVCVCGRPPWMRPFPPISG